MTGAPLPDGADAVVMVEHTERSGDRVNMSTLTQPRGKFQRAGHRKRGKAAPFSPRASRLGFRRNRAAGDGRPRVCHRLSDVRASRFCRPAMRSSRPATQPATISDPQFERLVDGRASRQGRRRSRTFCPSRATTTNRRADLLNKAWRHDLLLLSGGVSAGKYDIVERVLADLGAQFFFDRVLIQPGQPLVFGTARGKFFFGLPGNPASTMVTFEVFARAAWNFWVARRKLRCLCCKRSLSKDVQP